ncbi:hypothetical protein BU15DRAFT_80652 [Melanogaster broomeanus]|nr:hypothetical protein BU15DRAFT_80652 [Melanogaster broomeanus]
MEQVVLSSIQRREAPPYDGLNEYEELGGSAPAIQRIIDRASHRALANIERQDSREAPPYIGLNKREEQCKTALAALAFQTIIMRVSRFTGSVVEY